jgi:hypothetical protein
VPFSPTSVTPHPWLPLAVHPGPLSLAASSFDGPGLAQATVGRAARVTVTLRDRFGNRVPGIAPTVEAEAVLSGAFWGGVGVGLGWDASGFQCAAFWVSVCCGWLSVCCI